MLVRDSRLWNAPSWTYPRDRLMLFIFAVRLLDLSRLLIRERFRFLLVSLGFSRCSIFVRTCSISKLSLLIRLLNCSCFSIFALLNCSWLNAVCLSASFSDNSEWSFVSSGGSVFPSSFNSVSNWASNKISRCDKVPVSSNLSAWSGFHLALSPRYADTRWCSFSIDLINLHVCLYFLNFVIKADGKATPLSDQSSSVRIPSNETKSFIPLIFLLFLGFSFSFSIGFTSLISVFTIAIKNSRKLPTWQGFNYLNCTQIDKDSLTY